MHFARLVELLHMNHITNIFQFHMTRWNDPNVPFYCVYILLFFFLKLCGNRKGLKFLSLDFGCLSIDFNNFIKYLGALNSQHKIHNLHNLKFKNSKISQLQKQHNYDSDFNFILN